MRRRELARAIRVAASEKRASRRSDWTYKRVGGTSKDVRPHTPTPGRADFRRAFRLKDLREDSSDEFPLEPSLPHQPTWTVRGSNRAEHAVRSKNACEACGSNA